MNLKMVNYELDDTQFLVDAETNEDAIQKAIHANCNTYLLDEFDSEEDERDAKDSNNYTVESINDMKTLYSICHLSKAQFIVGLDNDETIIYMY